MSDNIFVAVAMQGGAYVEITSIKEISFEHSYYIVHFMINDFPQ
jgi:hypothetical protein